MLFPPLFSSFRLPSLLVVESETEGSHFGGGGGGREGGEGVGRLQGLDNPWRSAPAVVMVVAAGDLGGGGGGGG